MDVSEQWPLSLLKSPKRTSVPRDEGVATQRSIAESVAESVHDTWVKRVFPNLPKTVDTMLCALGLCLSLTSLLIDLFRVHPTR